jgi:hypothetical protein
MLSCFPACRPLQVIAETHGFYNKLRSGARANTEELSLV